MILAAVSLRISFSYRLALLCSEPLEALFNRLSIFADLQGVLGKFPPDTWHVERRPGEDILILTENLTSSLS